ncbi:sensor histidine kinase [Lewinella sp. JB7]|uniref:sensor histidine kinase n=1 Tax=Lewinella sp. JB7 TaxID=2962887 RepID=UPI0020C97792|nr:histidine kinase [Lewinella sp. JB7]MCP9235887.1 histidine kinase [Lewinella sp. JB7]
MKGARDWPWRKILLVGGLYLTFAIFYMLALYFAVPPEYRHGLNWRILYLDYPLKALYTLPIWLLTFRTFAHWNLVSRVLLNVVLLPVWVKGWQWSYYWLCDAYFGGGHLVGSGEWWDVYIPALFYVLQFGIFHSWTYYQDLRVAEVGRAEASRMALQSELDALKAQLNPHFLYNAFNTISASTGPGQERTRDMIAQLSDLFRYQLRANREHQLTLASELEFVTGYLALEHARFGDRLAYTVTVADPALYRALLPPLLLQPLVENAVRHGLSSLVEGGHVYIEVRAKADRLQFSVRDDGAGFDPARITYGYGIRNTRRRLALLYQTDLNVVSSPGRGTRCTFSIPLAYAPQSFSDRRRTTRPQPPAGIPE